MLEVAANLAGVHAQLMSSAELSLWARLDGLQREDVGAALWNQRTLVKAWAMRGTLHFLPASEYPMWQAALGTYRHFRRASWLRYFGLTETELDRLIASVAEALDGQTLTREELAGEVGRLSGSPELAEKMAGSWGSLLKPAGFLGKLVFAPSLGQRVRFTRPDRWLGGWREVDPDEAVHEVTRRFLGAHGPATREDFGRWWGVSPAQASTRIRQLGHKVVPVEVEGVRAWMLATHAEEIARAELPGSVRLVPAFDHYVISGGGHAERLLPGPFRKRIYRPQAWVSPVMLVDGRMDGVWRHDRKGSRLVVTLEPFVRLKAATKRAAEAEAERLAEFLGGSLEVVWADPP